MSSKKDNEVDEGRRDFFKGVTAGAAGAAIASALIQLGAPVIAEAQEAKKKDSPFFRNPPPWPKGTSGTKYDHLFSTKLRENSITDVVAGPQAYFRGDSDLPGAKINMGWQMFTKPYRLELESHHHDTDEYLFFLGAELPDLVGSFDGEIEYFMGPEYERHVVTKATVLYIPAGLEHNPCDIKRLTKPMMFSALQLAPYFNGKYQSMGYMEMKGMPKID
ncbi:MAG: hypothetical protein JW927_09065 [Deltaproteobacteria bacterium]|nr:hypothetical protein [Deltaproteobacteria bacterium]